MNPDIQAALLAREIERFPHMKRLDELAQRDVIINTHMKHWHYGGYESFEVCLVAIIVHQNEELERYRKAELDRVLKNQLDTSIIVPKV